MVWSTPRLVGVCAAALALAGLGTALASEQWGGLVPCPLCLWERWPYRVAIAVGVLAIALPRKPVFWLLGIVVLASVGLGATHVGVELGLWPSPLPMCSAPKLPIGGSLAERFAALPALPSKPCDEPVYLFRWLPISMAQMNLLFSAGCGWALLAFLRGKGRNA